MSEGPPQPQRAETETETVPTEGIENSFVIRLKIEGAGQEVGHCTMVWNQFRKMYELTNLIVDPKYQRGSNLNEKPDEYSGFGSKLLTAANDFLKARKMKGYLINTIEDSDKAGMYEKYGWMQDKENPKLFFFDGSI